MEKVTDIVDAYNNIAWDIGNDRPAVLFIHVWSTRFQGWFLESDSEMIPGSSFCVEGVRPGSQFHKLHFKNCLLFSSVCSIQLRSPFNIQKAILFSTRWLNEV